MKKVNIYEALWNVSRSEAMSYLNEIERNKKIYGNNLSYKETMKIIHKEMKEKIKKAKKS